MMEDAPRRADWHRAPGRLMAETTSWWNAVIGVGLAVAFLGSAALAAWLWYRARGRN